MHNTSGRRAPPIDPNVRCNTSPRLCPARHGPGNTDGRSPMKTISLSEHEVREAVSMREAIDAVRRGFAGLAGGEFEMPTRTALRDGRFLVMSAHHRPTQSAMIKTLSV